MAAIRENANCDPGGASSRRLRDAPARPPTSRQTWAFDAGSGGLWAHPADAACRGARILLQLDEQDIRGGVPNIFAVVFLGRQPTDRTCLKLHLSLNLARDQPS